MDRIDRYQSDGGGRKKDGVLMESWHSDEPFDVRFFGCREGCGIEGNVQSRFLHYADIQRLDSRFTVVLFLQ